MWCLKSESIKLLSHVPPSGRHLLYFFHFPLSCVHTIYVVSHDYLDVNPLANSCVEIFTQSTNRITMCLLALHFPNRCCSSSTLLCPPGHHNYNPAGGSVHETCMFQPIPCMIHAWYMHRSTIPCMDHAWFSLPCMVHTWFSLPCIICIEGTPDTVNNNFGSKNSKRLLKSF